MYFSKEKEKNISENAKSLLNYVSFVLMEY